MSDPTPSTCPSPSVPRRAAGALAALLAACGSSPAPAPAGTSPIAGWEGALTTYKLTSPVTGIVSRNVTVLLPPGYKDAAAAAKSYSVLYLHDGNNCLDHDPFGHGGWQVHTTATDLITRGLMAPVIIAMIDNSASRTEEYNPGTGVAPAATAEGYLDFVEHTVVPFVETNFRAAKGAANRGIGGSSFGGIISLYAGWTRPAVFGVVMAMSQAPRVYDFAGLVASSPGGKKALRIYLDSGTIDPFGPNGTNQVNDYQQATIDLRNLLAGRGWVLGQDLQYALGQGDEHNEAAWRRRLPGALPFLFPPGH